MMTWHIKIVIQNPFFLPFQEFAIQNFALESKEEEKKQKVNMVYMNINGVLYTIETLILLSCLSTTNPKLPILPLKAMDRSNLL